jgi:hypothetical protein
VTLGALQDESDLKRWLEDQLRTPGVVPQNPQPALSLMKAGAPSDDDFPGEPGNGILALDTTGPTLYARADGEWKAL